MKKTLLNVAFALMCACMAFGQGLTVQFQNAGTPLAGGTFKKWLPINCSTNTTCSVTNGVLTITATNTAATAWSGITAATNANAGTFAATGNSWDFTGVTIFKGRVGAGLTTSANGDFGYDSTNNNWHVWQNGIDSIAAVFSGALVNGHCPSISVSSGVTTLVDNGTCSLWSALAPSTNSTAGTFAASGNSWDFTGATLLKLRVSAGLTTTANGDIGYDTTNGNWHAFQNAGDRLVATFTGTITNGNCPQFQVAAGVSTLVDSGISCHTPTLQTNGGNNTTQTLLNFVTSTTNSVGLTITPSNPSGGNEKFEITGSSFTGNAATATNLTGCSGSAAGDFCYWNGSAWTRLAGNSATVKFMQEDASGVPSWASAISGSTTLSAISAATASNSISNGNFPQTWGWAQTTNSQAGFSFVDNSAATNGTLTSGVANQALLSVVTTTASTETPLSVSQGSVTGTTAFPAMQVTSTWNNGSLVGMGLLVNITDTASNAASTPFAIAKGGTVQYDVDKSGDTYQLGYHDVQVISTPGNPAVGFQRWFANNTNGLGCLTSAGANCNPASINANQALSNLSAVAINASLTPGSDNGIDLGAAALRFRNLFLAGNASWTDGAGNVDTVICRGAAGQVNIGTTTCNTLGTLAAFSVVLGSAPPASTGQIALPATAAPAAPASGTLIWFDSTDLRVHEIGAAGTIGTTVVAKTATSNQFVTAISAAGVITQAQPSSSNLSDVANIVFNQAANTFTAAGTLDLHSSTVADAFRTTAKAGATSAASGSFVFDTTNKNYHGFCNNADCIIPGFASAPTTGDVVTATVSSGNVLLSDAGFLGSNVVTDSGTATSNVLMKGAGSKAVQTSDLTEASNVLANATTTQAWSITGGADASANSALGGLTLRGADETGAGGATSAGGALLLRGGNNAATNASSQAGSVLLVSGASTGATQGIQGVLDFGQNYVKGGGTSTQWNGQCGTGSAWTVNDCGASPTNVVGVAEAVNSNTVVTLGIGSLTPINASAAVTLNHTVCWGSTAGKVTDSTGTTSCTNSQGMQAGVVVATSGTFLLGDGTSVTLSTTLPLIATNPAVLLPTAGGGSGTVGSCATTNALAIYTGSTTTGCGNADVTYATHTVTFGSAGILDLSATSVTAGLKLPSAAGAAPTADGFIAFNTTTHALVTGSNGTTIVQAAAATGTNSSTACSAHNWVSTISAVAVPTCTQPTASDLAAQPTLDVIGNLAGSKTFADGNLTLTFNSATTTNSQTAFTFGETTAATGSSDVGLQVSTLTTTTAILMQLTQGVAGPANAAAPDILKVSAAAAGGASGASNAGSAGAAIELLTGAGSAGGATTGNGGNGGVFSMTQGAGGAAGGTATNNGGNGGGLSWTTGAGGNGGSGAATAGSGGNVTFTMGAPGTNSATGTAGAVGLFNVTGNAPASTANAAGVNAGTLFSISGVAGGAISNTGTSAGGIGSSPSITGGAGGAATGAGTTATVGGVGGTVTLTAGAGGAGSAGNNSGGAGGNIALVPGAGGAKTGTGTAGVSGTVQIGSSPPAITLGTSGTMFLAEGTAPTGVSSSDGIYANSTNHCMTVNNNNADVGCLLAETSVITANKMLKVNGTAGQVVASSITDDGVTVNMTEFEKASPQTAQIITADWTCGTGGTQTTCVAAKTIGTLTFTLPLVAASWSYDCNLIVGQATAATANNWDIQTATNGATNIESSIVMYTAATVVQQLVTTGQASTTSAVDVGGATWTLGGTGTKMNVHWWGTIEGASASGTVLNFQLKAPTVGDLVTIYRGSECRVF